MLLKNNNSISVHFESLSMTSFLVINLDDFFPSLGDLLCDNLIIL